MQKIHILFIATFAIMLNSCAKNNGQYEALSTKPISLYSINAGGRVVKNVESNSSRHVAVIIPLSKAPTLGAAVNELLNEYDGDYLANVKIEKKTFQLMIWYHYSSWHIEADVVRINR